jgi:hypothetical protein
VIRDEELTLKTTETPQLIKSCQLIGSSAREAVTRGFEGGKLKNLRC